MAVVLRLAIPFLVAGVAVAARGDTTLRPTAAPPSPAPRQFGELASREGRAALQRLALDEAPVATRLGCTGDVWPVARFARDALAAPR